MGFSKIVLLSIILLIIVSVFLIIRSNILIIKSVKVESEKVGCADNNQIKDSSTLLGQNFFLVNSKNTENDLKKKFICIKRVEISKNFPDKIKLSVFGREPMAILVALKSNEATTSGELEEFIQFQSSSSAESSPSASFNFSVSGSIESFVVDNEGVIYSNNIEQINAPKVYISGTNLSLGQKIKEDLISNSLNILQKAKIFGIEIKEAKIYSERILLINGMPKIIFRLDNKTDTQIASLQLILDKAKIEQDILEFIDLRFDKPVVKIAPKKK